VLDPAFLDTSASIAAQVMQAVRSVSSSVEVWAGEVGPHNGGTDTGGAIPNCADNRVCGRFGSALWYADSMGSKAKAGYAAYCRQDFIGADYGLVNYTTLQPTADYYLLLLWKRLISPRVLTLASPTATTRAYAYCAAAGAGSSSSGTTTSAPPSSTSIVLVLVNLAATAECYSAPAGAAPGGTMTQYTLSPGDAALGVESAQTLFNGQLLELDGSGKLPALAGAAVPVAKGIVVPPTSVTLVLVPMTAAPACA
jgi:heparanase 1